MRTLYIMRHGQADGSLTPYGIESVREAANKLKEDLFVHLALIYGTENLPIYHSCLPRAKETAEILAESLTPTIEVAGYKCIVNATPIAATELNCDEYRIGDLVARTIDPVAILVSHLPDIEDYTRSSLRTAQWIRKKIE